MKKLVLLVFALSLLLPSIVSANIGVGVGTGKIIADQALRPGASYVLPPLVVINTGDEASDYAVNLQYREGQPELKPEVAWLSFEPESFYLEPGKTQTVEVKISLPVKGATPGDYFAFIQAHPVAKADVSGTSVGVAAAAKLYFTVAPASFFQGLYFRCLSLYNDYRPWPQIVIGVIILGVLVTVFRKKFKFNISLAKK